MKSLGVHFGSSRFLNIGKIGQQKQNTCKVLNPNLGTPCIIDICNQTNELPLNSKRD